jgi:hypothetical protein
MSISIALSAQGAMAVAMEICTRIADRVDLARIKATTPV